MRSRVVRLPVRASGKQAFSTAGQRALEPPARARPIGCRAVTEINKVGVVGCGLMGHGIAQICAQAEWDVVVRETDQEKLDKGVAKIEKQLAKAVEKGKLEQDAADAVRGRITPTLDYGDLEGSDLVIEAITEDLGQKLEMWREVDAVVGEGATFATNTSSLPVVDQAVATSRPDRFLGMHFFNPAQVMPLLEVVQTVTTSDEALKLGFEVGERLGKTTVAAKDKTGFIVNRLLVPYMLDAIRAYEEGFGSIEEIDTAMKAGANHPMGPLTLLDFVGLDTTQSIAEVMFDEFRERRFAPPPTLRKMVAAGMYGRKSGQGFYDYSGEKPVPSELGL
jgi:3-hydroxybutyryl-CoA dehydrogenase